MATRPRILVSNDDGIKSPGIEALVRALIASGVADIVVCAPSSERSAQSHAITQGRNLSAFPSEHMQQACPAVIEAWAVDGTPADSVRLALRSPVLKATDFDLVVSGINNGDNCGRHVIYSGTVAAAREGACMGLPAVALSLDNHKAHKPEDFKEAARLSAMLGKLPGQTSAPLDQLKGCILNVNVPEPAPPSVLQGFYLTHQGLCGSKVTQFPTFREVKEPSGSHLVEAGGHVQDSRIFRSFVGVLQEEGLEGADGWAMKSGYVSVTPLGLRSCVTSRHHAAFDPAGQDILSATASVIVAAAADMGLIAGGVPAKI